MQNRPYANGSRLLDDELNRHLAGEYGVKVEKKADYDKWLKSHQPFHWFVEFYGIMQSGGFDVIIGNPPYVEYVPSKVLYELKHQIYSTLNCGNLYAFVSERCCALCNQTGCFSLIMPAASVCTPRMHPLELALRQRFEITWISIWDERPSKLFNGVDQQLTIHFGRGCGPFKKILITSMRHWAAEEREHLFAEVTYFGIENNQRIADVVPKINRDEEMSLFSAMIAVPHCPSGMLMSGEGRTKIFYRNAGGRYWKLVKSFPTHFISDLGATATSTEKTFRVAKEHALVFVALLNSSTFYWFWRVCSNCRHLTDRELTIFPVAKSILEKENVDEFVILATQLEIHLKETKQRQTVVNKRSGTVIQDVFYVSTCKPIIDQIDQALAKHYGFTDEELDFIINYDIKYRMGRGADSEAD